MHLPECHRHFTRTYNRTDLLLLAHSTDETLVVRYIHSLFLFGREAIYTLVVYFLPTLKHPLHRLNVTDTAPLLTAHFAMPANSSRNASFEMCGIALQREKNDMKNYRVLRVYSTGCTLLLTALSCVLCVSPMCQFDLEREYEREIGMWKHTVMSSSIHSNNGKNGQSFVQGDDFITEQRRMVTTPKRRQIADRDSQKAACRLAVWKGLQLHRERKVERRIEIWTIASNTPRLFIVLVPV